MIPPSVSYGNSAGIKRINAGYQKLMRSKFSSEGVSFLKCAFAPPDFSVNKISGVPDTYEGNSLVKKHRLISPETFSNGRDHYIWLAPIPGVSHLSLITGAGTPVTQTDLWTPHYYSDYPSMFGTDATGQQTADIVTKFRFVSNHIEIVPTVNQMQWSGSIQAFKVPISLLPRQSSGVVSNDEFYSYSGMQAVNSTNSNQYSGPFFNGVYSGCFSQNCEFNFQQIIEGLGPRVPNTIKLGQDFTSIDGFIPGMDNGFESLIIKISGITTDNNAALVKTWACVEYQVLAGTALYEYQTSSPNDQMAIMAYKKLISELPVGVCYMDNENFWRRVLNLIRGVSGALSVVPGPYGAVATGVNMITTGINDLL
jgi:hypothetical protein